MLRRLVGRLFFKIGIVIILVFTLASIALAFVLHEEYKDIYVTESLDDMEQENELLLLSLRSLLSTEDFEVLFSYWVDHFTEIKEKISTVTSFLNIDSDMDADKYGGIHELFTSDQYADTFYDKDKFNLAVSYLLLCYRQFSIRIDNGDAVYFYRLSNSGQFTSLFTFGMIEDDYSILVSNKEMTTDQKTLLDRIMEDRYVGEDYADPDLYNENDREIMRVNTPVYISDDNAYVLTRDEDWTDIHSGIDDSVFRMLRGILIALVLISILIMLLMNLMITRKVIRIRRALIAYEKDNDSEKLRQSLDRSKRGNDEIDILAGELSNMALSIDAYIQQETYIASEIKKHAVEMDIAATIQMGNLLTDFESVTEDSDIDLYACMYPKKEVGGDYYGAVRVDEDHIAFLIADVSDKGIPAALYMMNSKTLIENCLRDDLSPEATLNYANDILSGNNEVDMFVTVWLCLVTISTGECRMVNAGHENPFLKKPGRDWHPVHNRHFLPIGSLPDIGYEGYTGRLEKGSLVFLYTDGVTDATNPAGERFGEERLTETLNSLNTADAKEIIDSVRERLHEFMDGEPPFDDITMLCFLY